MAITFDDIQKTHNNIKLILESMQTTSCKNEEDKAFNELKSLLTASKEQMLGLKITNPGLVPLMHIVNKLPNSTYEVVKPFTAGEILNSYQPCQTHHRSVKLPSIRQRVIELLREYKIYQTVNSNDCGSHTALKPK